MTNRIADGTGVLLQYPGVGVLHIVGAAADMPSDGEVGYAHGCIFQVTDTSGSDTGLYTNVGNRTSCNFDSIEVAGGSTDASTLAGVTPTAAGLDLLNDASPTAQRTTLGLGTFAVENIAAVPALTMAGNIALGAQYISRAGTAAGLSLDASNNATISGTLGVSGASSGGTGATLFATTGIYTPGFVWASGSLKLAADTILDRTTNNGTAMFRLNAPLQMINGGPVLSYNGSTDVRLYDNTYTTFGNLFAGNVSCYEGFVSTSDYSRIRTYWNGTTATIATENTGVGHPTARNIAITPAGGIVTINGHILAGTDNTYDIGASGANRPRTVYAGTSFVTSSLLSFTAAGRLTGQSQGVFTLSDGSAADFNRLQFGGTGSSYPALKRSSTQLQVRLADDSGYAPLACGLIIAAGGIAIAEATDITTGATTGTKIGAATTNKVGFWGTTPVVQPVHIADPAGGATVDAEARTAIAAINAMLAATGLTAAA